MRKVKTFQARKKETRDKIELGGLVVKAGFRTENAIAPAWRAD